MTNECVRDVDRGDSRWPLWAPCGRTAVGKDKDGNDTCSFHLKVDEKREQKEVKRRAVYEHGQNLVERAGELSKILGIPVFAHYSWASSSYTNDMVVPLVWLEELARLKKKAEAVEDA